MPAQEIVDALVAGAAAGGKETATSAVTDAYAALRALVMRRFADRDTARRALEQVETHAVDAGDGRAVDTGLRRALDGELARAGADGDDELADAAQVLLAALAEAGARTAGYVVDGRGSQGMVVGHDNTITQNFGAG